MKRCPNCGKEYPDEANFCPLDAGRLARAEPSQPIAGGGSKAPAAAAPAPSAGENVIGDRFYLGPRLGGSRTGEVYEAVDRSEGEKCAVKLVDPQVFQTSLQLQRTERELKQLERVEAKGVARVIAHGRHGDRLWLATEIANGRPLDQVVDSDGVMAPARAAALIVEIGEALGSAARVGVIHRDMSPKNVLVDGSAIKLINFGVPVPGLGKVQGVPEYVSPEQIEGRPVDQRSNIYSLGAIFYFLVTGAPPYSGSAEEIHQKHLAGSFSSAGGHSPLDPALDPVIARALERTSSRRYMTLRQFLDEVRRAAASAASTSAEVGTTTQPMGRPGAKKKEDKGNRDKRMAQTMLGGFAIDEGAGSTQKMGSAPAGQAPETEKMPSPRYAQTEPDPIPPAAAAAGNLAPPMESGPAAPASSPAESVPARSERGETPAAPAAPPGPAAEPLPAEPRGEVAGEAPATPVGQPWHEQVPESVTGEVARIAERAGHDVMDGPTTPEPGVPDSPMLAKRSEKRGQPEPQKEVESAGKGGKGRFRETLWFKKGALDAEVAEQAAITTPQRAGVPVADKADEMPIEDRYEDDGSIDARDKQAFSLRTGHSQSMRAMGDAPHATGDDGVSEDELISEMKGGRGKIIIALVVVVVVIAVLVAFFALRGGDGAADKKPPPATETAP